jgi:hypothetical protein
MLAYFYGHLVILWLFGNVVVIWYIFQRFGTLCQEKSCNPEDNPFVISQLNLRIYLM